jgi:uncharacterized protein YfeS
MEDDSPNFRNAHPHAQRFMDEGFYYSPIEESGPFGSDDGADTVAGFIEWRKDNPATNPLEYLQQQLDSWGYPPFDLQQSDPQYIQEYVEHHEMGVTYLVGMDAAIVALAFGQLYLEGTIDESLNALAKISLDRQLHPELLMLWDEHYQPTRSEQLGKMLSVLHRV